MNNNFNEDDSIPFYSKHYRPSEIIDLNHLTTGELNSNSEEPALEKTDFSNPYAIYQKLKSNIYKQDKYLKSLSLFFYNHCRGLKQTMLVTGPSGCGKTEALRCLQKISDVEIKICDGSLLTKQSYKGDYKITDLIITKTKNPIIVIDEFDKLLLSEMVSGFYSMQGEFLKLIEGGSIQVSDPTDKEKYDVDTSRMSFIFIGSFQVLEQERCDISKCSGIGFNSCTTVPKPFETSLTREDLIQKAGLYPELAGRINYLASVEPFSKQDFEKIILDKATSPLAKIEKSYDYKLRISESSLKKLANDAFEESLGIRGISNKLIELLNEQIFKDFESAETNNTNTL